MIQGLSPEYGPAPWFLGVSPELVAQTTAFRVGPLNPVLAALCYRAHPYLLGVVSETSYLAPLFWSCHSIQVSYPQTMALRLACFNHVDLLKFSGGGRIPSHSMDPN